MTHEDKNGGKTLNNRIVRALPLQIFIVSFITLAYETLLLRIFSFTLWYHFAFMIISIAMLGIGASGTVLYLFPRMADIRRTDLYYLLLSFSISLSYILTNKIPFDPPRLAWEMVQAIYVGAYCIILSVPFLISGLFVATVLKWAKVHTGFFYGIDLLGAGCGAFSVLLLLHLLPPDRTLLALSVAAILLTPLFNFKRFFLAATSLVLILAIPVFYPSLAKPRISPYKPLSLAMKYPDAKHIATFESPFSRVDLFKSPMARYAPGLSLQYLEPLPEQTGITINGDNLTALTSVDERKRLSFIKYLPSSIGFELSEKSSVLLIDPEGGLDVITAQQYGFNEIYRIESDPTIVKALKRVGSHIYRENSWTGLARTWLKRNKMHFDLINISMLSGIPGGVFGFSEDYRYTVETFMEYLRHLKEGGILSVNLYILPPPRAEFRVLNTLYEALKSAKVRDVQTHIVAIKSWGVINILVKKKPFTERDMEFIKTLCRQRGFDMLYYKGIKRKESGVFVKMSDSSYFDAFQTLLDEGLRDGFIDNYIFDIRARDDDHPFFHYYLKMKNVKDIYRAMGRKWQFFIQEGYMLPILLVVMVILGFLIIFLPVLIKGRASIRRTRAIPFLVYFASLGMGYMFLEIVLVQRLIYPLEHPTLAFAIVVSSVVMSSALGSISVNRYRELQRPFPVLILVMLTVIYGFFFQTLSGHLSVIPIWIRAVFVYLLIFPVGFLMGIPFPTGLSKIGSIDDSLIPWAWAVNGSMSVLSPVLGVMLALSLGYSSLFYLAGLIYFLAYLTQNRL